MGTTVKAVKAGAFEFFTKPVPEAELLTSIREAFERSRVRLAQEAEIRVLGIVTNHSRRASGRL